MDVTSDAEAISAYLDALPPERRSDIQTVRDVILRNLPEGYVETFGFGMICYVIPLERYPKTYNKQPLMLAALANRKNNMTFHLMTAYGGPISEEWLRESFAAAGKKLDMGKACIHFKTLGHLPLAVVAEAIRQVSVDDYIAMYERSRTKAESSLL